MNKITVIGGGTMGNGIAHVFAQFGYQVTLVDVAPAALEKAMSTIGNNLDRQIKKGTLTEAQKADILGRINPTSDLKAGVGQADLVVEAATENVNLKLNIFREMDLHAPEHAMLATNTSSISITQIAAVTKRPAQVIGMHFMNPVPVMKLVEVIRGYATSDAVTAQIMELSRKLEKVPVEVNDYPGFVANRILMPMINEAIYTLYESVSGVEEIDTVMKLGMAHPMGPLQLADFIGLDVCLSILRVLQDGFGNPKYAPCPLLVNMVTAGKLGAKSGEGFYVYTPGSKDLGGVAPIQKIKPMTAEEILRDIHAKKFAPVYCLHGEEPFFIDQIEMAVEAYVLTEGEKGFNQTVLYGKDVDHLTLLDYLRRYPMMSERQVVILREAQETKGLGELASYMENPMPSTVFVLCHKHKKIDMRSKLGKALSTKGLVVFESKKLYDNQVADWIISHCKHKRLRIEPAAAELMAEYLGADLSKIANELEKLTLNLPQDATITTANVQVNVGISKDYNVFELQKAFALRDKPKIARIEQYFASNIRKNPLIVTISSLFNYFSKVFVLHSLKGHSDTDLVRAMDLRSDWFLKEYKLAAANYTLEQTVKIISLLKTFDLRSKGVDTDTTNTGEEELMKEMFWKMLNA